MCHGIQTETCRVVQLAVEVQRSALVAVSAQAYFTMDEVSILGFLGAHIDRATCTTTASIGRVGALDHFDRFQIKHFARTGGDVTHAIHKGAGLSIHATDEGLVASGVAAFTIAKSDAGNGT